MPSPELDPGGELKRLKPRAIVAGGLAAQRRQGIRGVLGRELFALRAGEPAFHVLGGQHGHVVFEVSGDDLAAAVPIRDRGLRRVRRLVFAVRSASALAAAA